MLGELSRVSWGSALLQVFKPAGTVMADPEHHRPQRLKSTWTWIFVL